MTQSVRSGRGAALPLALVGAALLSAGTAGLAFAGEAPAENRPAATKFESPAKAAAAWAAKDLNAMLDAKDGQPKDHGLIADIVMGLASTRTAGATATKATKFLAAETDKYAFAGGDKSKVNSGGVAKLALVAEIEGQNPADFGGRNLIELLKRAQQPNGRFKGHETDPSQAFTQSLAVLALWRAGERTAAEKGAEFIGRNKCGVGGFPLALKDEPEGKACTPHMDSTGMAVQALIAAGVNKGVHRGLRWLQENQESDGSFKDLTLQANDKSGNSNSTALAVQALLAGDRTTPARKGIKWLTTVQVGCDKENAGAVGWNEPVADGKARRATAQVIPALAGKPFEHIDGRDSVDGVATIRCVADDTGSTPSQSASATATTSGKPTKSGTASPSPGTTTPAPTGTATATPTATATSTSDTTTGGGSGGTGGSSSDTGTSSGTGTSTGTSSGTGSGTDNASGSLARTGANTAFPVAIGAGALLLAGSAAVVVSRRRRRDDAV